MVPSVFQEAVFLRLAQPGKSKRAHAAKARESYGVPLAPQKFYRMMDHLDSERIAATWARVGQTVGQLLNHSVNVAFLDVTTLAFASEAEGDLRRQGFSKDGKPHRSQVVLALIQTEDGLPLTYELFPGNTADVATLAPLIEQLKGRYHVGRVIVVGDAGLLSRENLTRLDRAGFDWVVAAGLRKLRPQDLKAVTAPGWKDRELRDYTLRCGVLAGRRLIVRYSAAKARRDAHTRKKAVARAKRRLGSAVKGRGRDARYLTVASGAVALDHKAIERDELFDGLHGVLTNLDSSAQKVRSFYAQLWQIEHGFRVLKHTLAVRPVFHWTERRVRAHIAICFVAFALLRILRWRYLRQHPGHERLSEERLLAELAQVQTSIVVDDITGRRYLLPSARTAVRLMIYSTVGLSLPRYPKPLEQPSTS